MFRFTIRDVLWLTVAVAILSRSAAAEPPVDQAADTERKQRLELMQASVENVGVFRRDDEAQGATKLKLIDKPLMRYSDQPRGISDATLWAWGGDDGPEAVCKVEI